MAPATCVRAKSNTIAEKTQNTGFHSPQRATFGPQPVTVFERLAPPFSREFLPLISPRALQVLPIRALAEQALVISPRLVSGQGRKELMEEMRSSLPQGVRFSEEANPNFVKPSDLSVVQKAQLGQKILDLYFYQLQRSPVLFLDLRPNVFGWDLEREELVWNPSPFWAKLDSAFHQTVLDLYSGFYLANNAQLDRALKELQLVGSEELLRAHFGNGLHGPVRFTTSHLTASFQQIFDHVYEQQKQLHPGFAYLGIYITSLYMSLDELGVELDARRAYLNSRHPEPK